MKRALFALALVAGMLPGLGSAQTVRKTFGLGNVFEPTAACGTDGCQILIYVTAPTGPPSAPICPAGTAYTEAGCARRGPDEMISSGLLIQSNPGYTYYPIPGTITIEENTATGAVMIVPNADGTSSGHVNNVFIQDLDLGFDIFQIPSALNFSYNGAEGTHINDAGGDRIVWNNTKVYKGCDSDPNADCRAPGMPYRIQGCLTCQSTSGSGCALIGLGPPQGLSEGDPVCDALVQPEDTHTRSMPNWLSKDGFATWRFPDDGNGAFTGGDESIVADSADVGGVNNGGGWVLFGFLNRECGTKNPSSGDPFHANLGKPDYNCDGNADWTYGLGAIDEPTCIDSTRWCTATTQECNFDNDCTGGATCDPLPEKVCAGTSTECFINSECGAGVNCVRLGSSLCLNSATSCTSDAGCGGAPGSCKATSTSIFADGGDYNCFPLVDCNLRYCTDTTTPCTTNTQCTAPATCTSCPDGCFPNPTSGGQQCNKIDRSITQRASALGLMRDPEHDHYPLRGTVDLVEDLDAADTKWCTGGTLIPGFSKLSPKKLCTSGADCPAGETCDQATTVRWCTGTSTPCTTNAECGFGSVCNTVGAVHVPIGRVSGWNTNSNIIAFVPQLATTFTIVAAGRTSLEGATGYGSPNDVIVWNPPTEPYLIPPDGCNVCQSNTNFGCSAIFLTDKLIMCNSGQIGDPQVREFPELVSFDQGRTLQQRYPNGRPGDPNPGHIDAVIESFQSGLEANLTTNRGPSILFGYLRRECGTMNMSNAGNSAIYKFCSLENEYCIDNSECPEAHAQCNQAVGKCITPGQEVCSTDLNCPFVNQTCNRPAGNPFNPRAGFPDRDCDRKMDPGTFPIPSDPFDAEYPAPLPLPPDVTSDVCVTYVQTSDADSNGDGHGNQCSCGDQNRDGSVDVQDLVAINTAIFNPALQTLFCDANNDSRCNVSDIVDGNIEIFSPGTTANCVYNLRDTNP